MSKILVIGGSRFIGKHVIEQLNREKHEITVLNRGNVNRDKYLHPNNVHLKVDRNDKDAMMKNLSDMEFDVVYDICCITEAQARISYECLKGKINRYVHVSSASVYDERSEVINYIPITEDHPYAILNDDTHPYVRSKTEVELFFLAMFKDNGFPVTIVRPTFVYGPDNYIYREAYFFDRISNEQPILLPDHGLFDMTFVDDLAELIIFLGKADIKVLGQVYNSSTGFLISGDMFANMVGKIVGKKPKVVHLTKKIYEELQLPENFFLYPYSSWDAMGFSPLKSERELGFIHKHTYYEGLNISYKWWDNIENRSKVKGYSDIVLGIEELLIEYIKTESDEIKKRLDEEILLLKSEL